MKGFVGRLLDNMIARSIGAYARAQPAEERAYGPTWLMDLFGDWWGPTTSSGVSVSADSALTCVAFYSAVDMISRAIASLPLHLYQKGSDGGRNRADNHPLYDLIHTRPNPEQTAYTWRHAQQAWALGWGNSFAEIVRQGAGRPVALWPLAPKTMDVERDGSDLIYVQNKGTANQRTFDFMNVLHVRGLGDGLVGKSCARLFAENIGLNLAATKAGASFFGRGMRPSGVLEHPELLSDEALAHLRESLATGPGNFGKPFITEEGMKWKSLDIPPEDAQFIATLTHGVRDVARMFHVPPHKLADLADATFSNVEEQNIEWVQDCLGPWMVNWEQEINFKLLSPRERKAGYYAEFAAEGLLRGNSAARMTFYKGLWHLGATNQDEIREKENMNPLPDGVGKVYYVPANMVPADIAAKGPQKPAAPIPPNPSGEDTNPDEQQAAWRDLLEGVWGRIVRKEQKEFERHGTWEDSSGHIRWAYNLLEPVARSINPRIGRRAVGDMLRQQAAALEAEVEQAGGNGEMAEWFDDAPHVEAAQTLDLLLNGDPTHA